MSTTTIAMPQAPVKPRTLVEMNWGPDHAHRRQSRHLHQN